MESLVLTNVNQIWGFSAAASNPNFRQNLVKFLKTKVKQTISKNKDKISTHYMVGNKDTKGKEKWSFSEDLKGLTHKR